MFKRLVNLRIALNRDVLYYAPIILIAVLTVILLASNYFSDRPSKQMLEDAGSDLERVSVMLLNTQESFFSYKEKILEMASAYTFASDEYVCEFERQFDAMLDVYADLNPHISGYFVCLTSPSGQPLLQKYVNTTENKVLHISLLMETALIYGRGGINERLMDSGEAGFYPISNAITGSFLLSHIVPVHISGEYMGFIGATLDGGAIIANTAKSGQEIILLTEDLRVAAGTAELHAGSRIQGTAYGSVFETASDGYSGRKVKQNGEFSFIRSAHGKNVSIIVMSPLPTGQIFLESFPLTEMIIKTSFLISILAVTALLCIWGAHKKGGKSLIETLAARSIKNVNNFSDEFQISAKAFFTISVSCALANLAISAFILQGSQPVWIKAAFTMFFLLSLLPFVLRGRTQSVFFKYLYASGYLGAPILMHNISGGFASEYAGQIIVFCSLGVMLSCYVLSNEKKLSFFTLFVSLLFIDAIIEIFFIGTADPDYIIRFITVIFFLGLGIFIATDLYVTEVRSLLVRLKDAQSALVKKEKMVTLGQLMAGIAHEINTPLGAIKASAEGMSDQIKPAFSALMNLGGQLDEGGRAAFFELVDFALDSMNSMYTTMQIRRSKQPLKEFFEELGYENPSGMVEKLVRLEMCSADAVKRNRHLFDYPGAEKTVDLLLAVIPIVKGAYITLQSSLKAYKVIFALKSYSHTNMSSDTIWFNLEQNIDNVLVLLYNQMKRSVELVKDYDQDVPEVLGNPDELGQLWINLLQNAVYAMDGQGVLTLRIKKAPDYVTVAVEDTGSGIPANIINQIFEPFFTTKPLGEGSGLGLDICRKIVENHGGVISAESTENVGTSFKVKLPVRRSRNAGEDGGSYI